MAERITNADLNSVLRLINAEFGISNPQTKKVGSFLFDVAYGGVQLVRIANERGGEEDISPRLPKAQLYRWMRAFLKGINTYQQRRRR